LRAETTWRDLIGFGPIYAGILAAGWVGLCAADAARVESEAAAAPERQGDS